MCMGMKKPICALIVLVLLGLPGSARALETNELIALTAMPLVVAAAAELTDVPASELMNVVSTLNNAAVPPTQFVEIVRYAPVAIVAPAEPRFTTYVTTEYARGIVGEPLALSIADRYPTYGVEEIEILDPPVYTYAERRTILPEVVVTRFAPTRFDPLALVAMPLAVAAVAELTDVPAGDLVSFISSLNRARMPPTQFVEVVRYSPVLLVDSRERPLLLSYVTTEIDRGVVGRPLAFVLANRIGIDDVDILRPPPILVDRDEFLPPVVVTRVAQVRAHPHGGPPGQVKKELGLQTGAEVVHGTRRSRPDRAVARTDRDRNDGPPARPGKVAKPGRDRDERRVRGRADDPSRGKPRVSKPSRGSGSQGQGGRVDKGKPESKDNSARGKAGGKGNAAGKGKGKGKGKG